MCAISGFEYAYQLSHQKEAVSNAKFETASLGLTRGIGRFEVAKRPNGSEWR